LPIHLGRTFLPPQTWKVIFVWFVVTTTSPAPTELALLMSKSFQPYVSCWSQRSVTTTTGAHHEGEFNSKSTMNTQTNPNPHPLTRNPPSCPQPHHWKSCQPRIPRCCRPCLCHPYACLRSLNGAPFWR
jgi:hypothetical protein